MTEQKTTPRADLEYWLKRAAHWEARAAEAISDAERRRLAAEAEFALYRAIRAEEQIANG